MNYIHHKYFYKSRIEKTFLIFFFLIFFDTLYAQKPIQDFQLWQNCEIEYNFNLRWSGHLQEQVRLTENDSRFSYSYYDIGTSYRVAKNIRLSLDYILVEKQKLDFTFSTRNQYNIYLNFRKRVDRITFFDRVLTEGQFTDFSTSKSGKQLGDVYMRNKISARYKLISKLSAYVSDEVYFKLDGVIHERGFNRNRLSSGLLYKLSDYWLLETFYLFEDNFSSPMPTQNFVVGVGISKSFFQ
ncbi:MAG TPA: DUF2490 domain-containing protein [Bacteroidia bacterium]|nr:DUF2490 domain-containing protein [Bacteroidia bacterium]